MDGAEIELEHPVEADGETVRTVRMRRPKVRDMRAASRAAANPEEREIALIVNLCSLSPETVDEIDMADYGRIQDALVGFTGSPKR